MVAGGLEEMSYTTRLMPRTSLMMRLDTCASKSCGMLSEIPESLRSYIDYKSYANDCRCGGDVTFVEEGGECWVFSNN